ncbi:MAG TPA: transporter [Steroidobacteraceae bacterium]|nr:transporter [Steroidobacteraceae bacterium]
MNTAKQREIGYGSDRSGLVWGYRFAPGRAPEPIDCEAAVAHLSATDESESRSTWFIWLHFSLSNANSERWMRQHLKLPATFYDSLHEQLGSTRLEIEDNALVAIIHDVLFNAIFDSASISTLMLCMEPRLIVSARLRPLRSVDRLREAVREGQNLRSSAELLAHLLRDQAAVLVDIVRQSTLRVDAIEDSLLANRVAVSRGGLSALRRALVRLQRLLAPEPAALFRLLNRPAAWLSREDLEDLRQAAEEFSAAVGDSAALAERLKLLQEELAAMVGEHINRSLFILTLVTVLALPINVVAGLLGMNVGGLPLAQHPEGFLIVVSALSLMTALLAYFFLIKRRD